jgi:hypothetical protein
MLEFKHVKEHRNQNPHKIEAFVYSSPDYFTIKQKNHQLNLHTCGQRHNKQINLLFHSEEEAIFYAHKFNELGMNAAHFDMGNTTTSFISSEFDRSVMKIARLNKMTKKELLDDILKHGISSPYDSTYSFFDVSLFKDVPVKFDCYSHCKHLYHGMPSFALKYPEYKGYLKEDINKILKENFELIKAGIEHYQLTHIYSFDVVEVPFNAEVGLTGIQIHIRGSKHD